MIGNLTQQEKINIYKNIFIGRKDVFAVYWENKDKAKRGYAPVCINEWKAGVCNKLQKRKCKDCKYKKYAEFNDYHIEQHLRGNKIYGIYPLLEDNTSLFIAADFDKKDWLKNSNEFIKKCNNNGLSAYLERSKSGNGGHVWMFFSDRYHAHKSRNIALNILKEAGIIGQFEKEESFDRLFPNQDYLGGGGFGNLIALPFQGNARKSGNTVFLDPDNSFEPFEDQWNFLRKVERMSPATMDALYDKFNNKGSITGKSSKNCVSITIKEKIFISKGGISKALASFLKEELNFVNSEYLIKKKMGVSVYGVERYFKLIETVGDDVSLPRGFLGKMINFLSDNNIKFKITDERKKLDSIKINMDIKLFNYQKEAIEAVVSEDNGILSAPAGSGKTIMGLELVARLAQPALILVHKKQIYDQWIERIGHFLNIPKKEIGEFCSGKRKVGNRITVAMIQTLSRMDNLQEYSDKFGTIIVDECHHVPARMFRNVITKFNPYYLYGLTATPERKNNDARLIFIYLGDILHQVDANYCRNKTLPSENLQQAEIKKVKVIIRETHLKLPFKIKADDYQFLSKIIIFDSSRNIQIVNDIMGEADKGLKCLVLTERKEHVEVLSYYLRGKYEIITLTGDLTEKQRKGKIKQIQDGNFQILIATGQLIGEGADFPNLDCLFLVYPFAFSGKLAQYVGRVQRGSGKENSIYDYRDSNVEYLEKFFKKRKSYYKKNFDLDC